MNKASKLVLMLFMGLLFAGKAHVQELKHAPTDAHVCKREDASQAPARIVKEATKPPTGPRD